jgi:DNA-binding Xre family transcriptional regulator
MEQVIDRWRLHQACLDRRIKVIRLAQEASIRPDRLYKLIAGYYSPRRDELERLATALDLQPEDLLQDGERP